MTAWTRFCLMIAMLVMCVGTAQGAVTANADHINGMPDTRSTAVNFAQQKARDRLGGLYSGVSPNADRSTATVTNSSHEAIAPPMSSTQSTNLDCTIVELYPGYPGYRGNITGVMPHYGGLGDYECMHILEQDFPQFDRAQEDRANQQAADALGINGPMNLWTWENWMLIEAERGLLPSCYTCLMFDTMSTPHRMNVYPDPDDYRILTGFIGQTTGIHAITNSLGASSPGEVRLTSEYYAGDDYVLRATAYVMGGPTQNAQELYEEMQRWVQHLFLPSDGISNILPSEILRIAIWEQGGYSWVPDNATVDDQVTMMLYAFAVAGTLFGPFVLDSVWFDFDESITSWFAEGSAVPLDTFMQQQPIWQEYGP
ncbi:hypothetical protein BH24CHL2_BH24CHL2_6340 [soil metagenome]